MSERRKAGGYVWVDKTERIIRQSEIVTKGLTELSNHARTVEVSNLIIRLVAANSDIAVTAMELKGYKP